MAASRQFGDAGDVLSFNPQSPSRKSYALHWKYSTSGAARRQELQAYNPAAYVKSEALEQQPLLAGPRV